MELHLPHWDNIHPFYVLALPVPQYCKKTISWGHFRKCCRRISCLGALSKKFLGSHVVQLGLTGGLLLAASLPAAVSNSSRFVLKTSHVTNIAISASGKTRKWYRVTLGIAGNSMEQFLEFPWATVCQFQVFSWSDVATSQMLHNPYTHPQPSHQLPGLA